MTTEPVWTPEKIAILKRLNAEGYTHKQIVARIAGLKSPGAVASKLGRLRDAGEIAPAARGRKTSVSNSVRTMIVDAYFRLNKSIYTIARETGVLSLTVEEIIRGARQERLAA